jgi:hypothetical protein
MGPALMSLRNGNVMKRMCDRWALLAAAVAGASLTLGGDVSNSCQAVCSEYPVRVQKLFAALNLDHPGLEQTKASVAAADLPAACEALLRYYREGPNAAWLRGGAPAPGAGRDAGADAILNDTFSFQSLTARQPRRADGGLDWLHRGPQNDVEWANMLNRHYGLVSLLQAWKRTGNAAYARGIDSLLRDWLLANPYTGKLTTAPPWRSLETGLRLRDTWPQLFFGLQPAESFSPATRILMLASIPDHADSCIRLHGEGNWYLMELNGLAHAAACWPEFRDATNWLDTAISAIVPELKKQVYPDGVHNEMSLGYHHVAANNFAPMIDYARRAGRTLPDDYVRGTENLWNYMAYALRPDGRGPLSGDSTPENYAARLAGGLAFFPRDDWRFIVSHGKEGRIRDGPPSFVWPDSGQIAMRSGWDPQAQWSYFDAGPHGGWHGHYDDLSFTLFAFGRDLLVDGGISTYKNNGWRRYFRGSAAHNVILVDGAGQNDAGSGTNLRGQFAIRPEFDFVRATHGTGFGAITNVTHTRAVLYLRGVCWVVADRVTVDRPRTLDVLWHFHPDCAVQAQGLTVASVDAGKGNLRIVPVGGQPWELLLAKGQETPMLQGWYSPAYNVVQPSFTAVYHANVSETCDFAWVLVPAADTVPEVRVTALAAPAGAVRLQIELAGRERVEVAVRLAGREPIGLSGGLQLEPQAQCAVRWAVDKPLVFGGRVLDDAGRPLAEDETGVRLRGAGDGEKPPTAPSALLRPARAPESDRPHPWR